MDTLTKVLIKQPVLQRLCVNTCRSQFIIAKKSSKNERCIYCVWDLISRSGSTLDLYALY